MAERFDEIDFDGEQDPIGALMHAFRNMMDFAVHWYDFRDGDWEHVCIHESREKEPSCWPGDNVASAVMALSNDLRTAFEPPMNTLRREMREDLVNRWHAAQERGERLERAKILGGQFSHRCLMSALQWTAGFQEEPPAISHSIAWLGWSFLILIIVAA